MRRLRFPKISLARKCQVLFGAAVLSIIAASLVIPGVRMEDLTLQGYVRIAKDAATIALMDVSADLQAADWSTAQGNLARDWARLSRLGEGEFPTVPPRLISLDAARMNAAIGAHGFLAETINQLSADRQALYRFKLTKDDSNQRLVRLAMAVRAPEGSDDPGALRGLIEVRVPIRGAYDLLNMGVLAAALSCGAVLALLVFYFITQRLLLSPVRKLRRLAEKVASGEVELRSEIATGDEFEDLAHAFNDMLANLQHSQEELRKINVSLDTRLGELAETNVALYESNRVKSEFIANVSHELRTPLVSIIGFAELLAEFGEDPPPTPKRLTRYAHNILTSGRMLLDIINDLLDLAKIEAGKLELHVVDVDIAALCTALIDFTTPLAEKSELSIALELDDELPHMVTDAGRLKQILYNLMSNAIKFTPKSGHVSLKVTLEADEMVAFAVTDTGQGISSDQLAVIFEKFHQIDSSHTREFSGTGLGLAITRELSAMLGGDVRVESEVDKGSTFTVTIPIRTPAEPRMPLVNLT